MDEETPVRVLEEMVVEALVLLGPMMRHQEFLIQEEVEELVEILLIMGLMDQVVPVL